MLLRSDSDVTWRGVFPVSTGILEDNSHPQALGLTDCICVLIMYYPKLARPQEDFLTFCFTV